MTWWLWVLVGFGLLVCELVTPSGFFFLFFGAGAIVVGALVWAGIAGPAWVQWLLFTAVSVAAMLPLRRHLVRWMTPEERAVDSLVGQTAVLLEEVAPGGVGKAELRGTTWTARNGGERALQKGERAAVVRVDGLTLWLGG